MKRLLFIFCALFFVCSAQGQMNVVLKADSLSVTVSKTQYPKNTLKVTYSDTDSTLLIAGANDNNTFIPQRKWTYFLNPATGLSFASYPDLKTWITTNFFVDAVSSSDTSNGSLWKGGQSIFTADGTTVVFDITHNLNATPSYFTLTTTTPITVNQLNRTITFPNANTMRITFNNAPLVGENTNYVWIVYK